MSVKNLILGIFLTENSVNETIDSLPGVQRWCLDRLPELCAELTEVGIPGVALFPQVPADKKTADCREAYVPDNLICRALEVFAQQAPQIMTICDVALDPYNPAGHDGFVMEDGSIDNDSTLVALRRQAVCLARAGAKIVAPSDMMDGRIGAIRDALDKAGYPNLPILSYAAKYASAFYGPFREAIGSASALKTDKGTYQMDPANAFEARREVAQDIAQGANLVMVKPGTPYLDIVKDIKDQFEMPTFVYHVSGEYAALKAAAQNGWLDYDRCILELMMGFRRAGADAILTYAAMDVARLLRQRDGLGG